MKPLFTIHAGEFLVGEFIERKFRRANIWIPAKDSGVDLLVSDSKARKTVSLQVKFSRDFLATHMPAVFQKPLRACGWWTLDRRRILRSPADYWVFVLAGFENRSTDFVIIKPKDLLKHLNRIHGRGDRIQTYLWVTETNRCWETRGLNRPDHFLIADGRYENPVRDFSAYLNNWKPIQALNK
jgi:hypothetical protein